MGEDGFILRTRDGGRTWVYYVGPTAWDLNRVCFIDSNHGWISTAADTIFRTTDGGNTWTGGYVSRGHWGIIFVDTLKGFSVSIGGIFHISKTTDGGNTWILRTDNTIPPTICIEMVDSLQGYSGGNPGFIVMTRDGWETWTSQPVTNGSWIRDISFNDSLNGFFVGAGADTGKIFKTTNGGLTWIGAPYLLHDFLNGVDAKQLPLAWVCGNGGSIIKTTTMGNNWVVKRNSDIDNTTLLNTIFINSDLGWAVGTYGVITHTKNGGTVWQRQTSNVNSFLYGVSFADSQHGKICTDGGGVLGTRNGGNTWAGESTGAASPLWSIDYPDTSFAVAVGGYYGPLNSGIRDQGLGFREKGEIASSSRFASGTPRNDTFRNDTLRNDTLPLKETSRDLCKRRGRLGGTNPTTAYRTITRTTNGGATWIAQNTNANPLYGVKFITRDHGWACGDGGTVLHTTDLGATWQTQTTGVTNGLYWITFQDTLHGWACGSGGRVLWTTDGGNTWNIGNSGVTQYLWSIAFADTLTGFAVSDNGLIIRSTDGGRNWVPDTSKVYANLTAVCALDSTHVWTVGSFGMVLGWGEAGNTGIETRGQGEGETRRPETALGQSYPNPTRGIASFEYELARTEKVRVRVYNIAGQAVRTLVEGMEPAGRHVVTWDGRDEAGRKAGSGTYFYQLEAGGRKTTRKMVVVR